MTNLASRLRTAIQAGNIEQIRTILRDGADSNQPDEHGVTPLACAAFTGHTSILEALLAANADPNGLSVDPSGEIKPDEQVPPLVIAAIHDHKRAFVRLAHASKPKTRKAAQKRIKKHWRSHDKKAWKRDPRIKALHAAVDRNDVQTVLRLIAEGVQVNVGDEDNGNPPLTKACINKSLELVQALVKAGAKPDGFLGTDLPPLAGAMTLEIARALLTAGADPMPGIIAAN